MEELKQYLNENHIPIVDENDQYIQCSTDCNSVLTHALALFKQGYDTALKPTQPGALYVRKHSMKLS